MSTLDSQQPKPGCEWYQPTTLSGLRARQRAPYPRRPRARAPARLLEHLDHPRLEDVVDRLDGDGRARLRHREDVDDLDRVLVHELAEHEAHDLHRHAGAPVLEHLRAAPSARGARNGERARHTLSSASEEMWMTSPLDA
jgi:hypothetical protein